MEKKVSFIVLLPQSRTNPSDKYCVVEYNEWLAYVNEEVDEYDYVEFDTFEVAEKFKDESNRGLGD